jgi:hypothetical protein
MSVLLWRVTYPYQGTMPLMALGSGINFPLDISQAMMEKTEIHFLT